jgi:hypothetical protein
MNRIILGMICGAGFGLIDILIMIPVKYQNSRERVEVMSAAFLERFMIGFLIPNVNLGFSHFIEGLLLGIGLSLPSAIITRAYVPIIGIGAVGGLIIGLIV